VPTFLAQARDRVDKLAWPKGTVGVAKTA